MIVEYLQKLTHVWLYIPADKVGISRRLASHSRSPYKSGPQNHRRPLLPGLQKNSPLRAKLLRRSVQLQRALYVVNWMNEIRRRPIQSPLNRGRGEVSGHTLRSGRGLSAHKLDRHVAADY